MTYGQNKASLATWDADMLQSCLCDGTPDFSKASPSGDVGFFIDHQCRKRVYTQLRIRLSSSSSPSPSSSLFLAPHALSNIPLCTYRVLLLAQPRDILFVFFRRLFAAFHRLVSVRP